ncbi:LysR family transcriptional regulator [Bradyrhizobium roseum]|uniref:LysR family transcriptional regulator n=1 Tax=Bradyrhizobium roseum TaxID=3056648 RepID=UPI0026083500|nr:LysR family transcriptional regulator [Bradyrhizobium roseus]WKA26454.1 LysR family transcriptional regulator [Bradyrhizobium roseus]
MLNLTHARSFVTVIATRGVRAAARQLDLAPSTIVEHIRQLEEVLAAPLVVRRRGGALPTDQGARFLPLARSLVETAGRVRSLIHLPALRVAASSNVGTYLLQPHIAAFRQSARIPVEQWIGSNSDVVARLERGEADLAAMEWWDGRPGFTTRTWRREPLVVIVGPGHRWARLGSVSVTALQGEPLLGGESGTGTGYLLRRQLGPLAKSLAIVDGFGNTEAVKRAVRAGYGSSIVMEASVADEVATAQLVALRIEGVELAKEIKLIVPEALPPTAPAMAMFEASRLWGRDLAI